MLEKTNTLRDTKDFRPRRSHFTFLLFSQLECAEHGTQTGLGGATTHAKQQRAPDHLSAAQAHPDTQESHDYEAEHRQQQHHAHHGRDDCGQGVRVRLHRREKGLRAEHEGTGRDGVHHR